MLTNVKNAVVVPCAEFLLIATPAGSGKQYHLLVLNTDTGKSESIVLSGDVPRNEDHLLDEFNTMLSVVSLLGFKTMKVFQEIYTEYGMDELSMLEMIEEYNEIAEKSRFALNIMGSLERISDIDAVVYS